ncbi:MAG TPA: HPP family protein [Abditibacteriaceae bacterium]|jgi:CBS-domain-containing membrane protein
MQTLKQWIGVELDEVSRKEKFVSMAGGLIAILLIVGISQNILHLSGASMLIASMGASAVLLFAVPHGQLSQPWPVLAGHVFSAFIGVTCAKFIALPWLAAGCAVALSIGAMHQFRCIHPPGGATALTAVIGSAAVKKLGYWFVVSPVLLNAVAIVAVAIAFNSLFEWRRYPASLSHPQNVSAEDSTISHEAVVAALKSLDSFVDITEDDLIRLCDILSKNQSIDEKR